MGRKAWIWAIGTIALAAILAWAWADGGYRPMRWIEEPVDLPAEAG